MPEDTKTEFPKNFLWGASTSAHQVEGGTHNQWTIWELENAARLARESEKRYGHLPIWPQIEKQAKDPANYVSGPAVDHYRRYEDDFKLLPQLNLNSFRFGVEWSRIEPEEGVWNEEAIEHYKQYLASLKKQGIKPVITLWHWTMPVWFYKRGGFASRKNIKYFLRFVDKIADDLILPCHMVLTFNEPNSYVGLGYFDRTWPPQKNDPLEAVSVILNIAKAHRETYKLLKARKPSLLIGVAHQCNNSQPKRPGNLFDKFMAGAANYGWNWFFLDRIKRHQDFVGFNYYFTDYFKGFKRSNPKKLLKAPAQRGIAGGRRHNPLGPLNDMGWYMEPSGIYHVIMNISKRYRKPIYITENGVPDATDQYRRWWIEDTLNAVQRANAQGAEVRGYFYWSLLDNFEWSQGFWPKFGLVEVDRQNGMKRTIRPTAKWFAEQIKKLSV